MEPTDLQTYFPNNQLGNLADDLVNVKTWEDFERRLLYGTGKSRETYKTYLVACKQFHEFTNGEHPMQAGTVANVEAYYDSILADGVSLQTAKLRMSSLKYMFGRVQDRFPIWQSPFDVINEVVKEKLNRSERDTAEKGALTAKEYRAILSMLRKDISLKGSQNYAYFRFLVVSGLRSFEAVGLRWKQIDECENGYKLTIVRKGNKKATIGIEDRECIKALRRGFRLRFGRVSQGDDLVFQSTGTGRGGDTLGISKGGLAARIAAVIDAARKAGVIIRQNLAFSTHTTRHTTASLLVEAGVDLETVRRHMRQSNLNTTQVYLHTDADKSEAWAKINGEVAA
jgi:integrase